MKLVRLELSWFRQHKDSRIDLPDGLIGVVGSNGSGKTSLVEAVSFALFGSKAIRGRVEELKTRGAPRDAVTKVILLFQHDQGMYRVERSTVTARLFVGGETTPQVTGTREVTGAVAALLGMNYEEFSATYLTEQKGLEFLSARKGATERERFIVRMMGYDKLEKVQELLRSDRREKRAVLQGWEAGLGDREEREARLRLESQTVHALQTTHEEASKALTQVEAERNQAKRRLEQVELLKGEHTKLAQLLGELQIRRDERRSRLASLQEARDTLLARYREELAPARLVRLSAEIETGRAALSAAEQGVEEAAREAQRVEESWREGIHRAEAELSAARGRHDQAAMRRTDLQALEAGSECPTCGQTLGESFQRVQGALDEEFAALHVAVERLSASVTNASRIPPSVVEARRLVETRVARRVEAEAILRSLQGFEKVGEEVARLSAEGVGIDQDLVKLEAEISRADAKLKEVRYSEEAYLRAKGGWDASSRLMEVSRLQRMKIEGELQTARALLERTRGELHAHDEKTAQVEALRREIILLDESDRVLSEFRRYLNASIRPRLAELSGEYLTDLTDGRYSSVEIGEDFSPTLYDDGDPKPVISGGEEDILNLCVRLALSNMLAERAGHAFSLLILDEVFGSLDENRRMNVLLLLEKLKNRFDQILVITHLDDIKDGVEHLVAVGYDDATGEVEVGRVIALEEM